MVAAEGRFLALRATCENDGVEGSKSGTSPLLWVGVPCVGGESWPMACPSPAIGVGEAPFAPEALAAWWAPLAFAAGAGEGVIGEAGVGGGGSKGGEEEEAEDGAFPLPAAPLVAP